MKNLFLSLIISCFVLSCSAARHERVGPALPTEEEKLMDAYGKKEKDGNLEDALKGYLKLCNEYELHRACYNYTRVLFLIDTDVAWEASLGFILSWPDGALTEPALRRLSTSYRNSQEFKKGIKQLENIFSATLNTEIWDSVAYEIAGLYKEIGNTKQEVYYLNKIIDLGRWGSAVWDNSMWRLAQIAREQDHFAKEEQILKDLLDAKESSFLFGSYNSPFFDDAQLRLGQLYYEQGSLNKAFRSFRRLSRWTTSTLRDDAFLWMAKVKHKQGKNKTACNQLVVITKDEEFFGSHKKAKVLLKKWECEIN